MTEAGAMDLISEDEEEEAGADIRLPGVHRGCEQTCSMWCEMQKINWLSFFF